MEINKRYFINEHSESLANGKVIDKALTDWFFRTAAWSYTTCGFCVEVCPVGNEPMLDILTRRQDLVMMESKFPKDAMETFDKMEIYGNPWGLSPQDREKWMVNKEVPLMKKRIRSRCFILGWLLRCI